MMEPTPVRQLRYTVSPTVKEVYEEGEEAYRAAGEIPVMAKLSNENDQVSGLESVYGYILSNHASKLDHSIFTGNEGFVDFIKSGFNSIIQTIKDFFKWIWSFFGSKKGALDTKVHSVSAVLDKKGAKDKPTEYPSGTIFIYTKEGKPESNINWLSDAMVNIVRAIDKSTHYSDELKKFLEGIPKHDNSTFDKGAVKVKEEFLHNTKDSFKSVEGKPFSFVGKGDMVIKEGRFALVNNGDKLKDFKGVTFLSSTSQLQGYMKDYNTITKKLDGLSTKIHDLEGTFIKCANDSIEFFMRANKDKTPELKAAVAAVQESIRNAMANLKLIQNSIYRASKTVLEIISAATA